MKKGVFVLLLVVLALSIVAANHPDAGEATHAKTEGVHMDHSESLDVSGPNAPSVSVVVHEDPKSGWNIQLVTENFEFAPERASREHVLGEGHAHIYVDGKKINRVYGEWYHISDLEEGEHEISAILSANDHRELTVDSNPVEGSVTVTVGPHQAMEEAHQGEEMMRQDHNDKNGVAWWWIVVGVILGVIAGMYIKNK